MSELRRAIDRRTRAKEAAGAGRNEVAEEEKARLVFSGLDLDYDELIEESMGMVAAAFDALLRNAPVAAVIQGSWVDGISIGIEIERERNRS